MITSSPVSAERQIRGQTQKRSDQCSIPNAHPMRIEHWELSIGQIFMRLSPNYPFVPFLLDGSLRGREARLRVPQYPPDHASVVIHVADDVVQCGEAMQLALLLHLAELMLIELRLSDNAPVVSRGVHGEAGRQRAVRTDDYSVAASAAAPRRDVSAQELLHLKY